jgi:hypothetical protein
VTPYLFIIGAEVLARCIADVQGQGLLRGLQLRGEEDNICYLGYADDCLIFNQASLFQCWQLKRVMEKYCSISGQSINKNKSVVIFGKGVQSGIRRRILKTLGFSLGSLPFRYLGAMIGIDRLRVSDFEPLLDKVRKKLSTWKSKSLAFAGRVTLIKAVLQSMPIFILSASWVPKTVIEKLEQLFRMFLWSKDGKTRGLAMIKYDDLRKLRENEGLGFRRLDQFHEALMGRQILRNMKDPNSIWVRATKAKYGYGGSVWRMKQIKGCSQS